MPEPSDPDLVSDFRFTMMYHPSHHVPDLAEAEEWFARVFGCESTPLASMMRQAPSRNGYPTDYSTFTPIRDVLFDTIDPKRYVLLGKQRYKTVDTPHLKGFGWYIEGMPGVYLAMKDAGFTIVNQVDELAEGDETPTASGSPMPLFFSVPDDAGLRFEFFPAIPFPLDPRVADGWTLPPVADDDPLGIDRCSHHTVLTDQPARALRLLVDTLGAEIVHTGRNELLGADSTYLHFADSILEYAVPDAETDAHADWSLDAPNDTYHAITWKVIDLDRAERHLSAQGVAIRARSADTIITEPATSLGVPWGFTTTLTPGDPRATL